MIKQFKAIGKRLLTLANFVKISQHYSTGFCFFKVVKFNGFLRARF